MENSRRREFLKKSIIGITGAALIPGSMKASLTGEQLKDKIPEPPTRILGKTGIRTPLISMGTGSANSSGFIKAAYFAGVKLSL